MEARYLMCDQFFFAANGLGRQPPTLQYFQTLALQTVVLAAAAIHFALSEYASGEKATVEFSHNKC